MVYYNLSQPSCWSYLGWSYYNDFFWNGWNFEKMNKTFLFVPLIIVVLIVVFCLIFLLQGKDPSKPPSALLYKNLPDFDIVSLFDNTSVISNKDLKGDIMLINFFASWCAPCKEEHPLLFSLKNKHPNIIIIGINYKDTKSNAIKFLENEGNPYQFIGVDKNGKIGLEFGVIGLPETFLTNNKGEIVFKHTGPLTSKIIKNEIIPQLQ